MGETSDMLLFKLSSTQLPNEYSKCIVLPTTFAYYGGIRFALSSFLPETIDLDYAAAVLSAGVNQERRASRLINPSPTKAWEAIASR